MVCAKIEGTTPRTYVLPEQRMCRTRTNRFRAAVSAEKEGGGQGGNYSVESSGNSRCSDVVTVRCGTGVATFGRARMGARVPVHGMMKYRLQ